MMLLTILFTPVIVVLIFSFLYDKYVQNQNKCFVNITGPKPNFLFGNLWDFIGPSHKYINTFRRYMRDYGNTIIVYEGPFKPLIVSSDEKLLEFVLSSTKILDKSNKYDGLLDWLGTGLLTSTGQKWKDRRRLITPAFHFSVLNDFIKTFETNSDIFIDKLKEHVGGKAFNIHALVSLCTLDIICEAAMGISVNAMTDGNSEYVTNVKKICELITVRNFSILNSTFFKFTLTYYRGLKIIQKLHDYTDNVILKRIAELKESKIKKNDDKTPKKNWNLLDLLINSTVNGEPLSKLDIREEVDTFMFEGHDTTAGAISFALYALANNPSCQRKAFMEQRDLFYDYREAKVTMHHLQNMKYLDLIIRETLRLYTTVPMFGRTTPDEDLEWEGNIIPKRTQIMFIPFITHRNPKYYPCPFEFLPERFFEFDGTHPYRFVPFSAGSRNCIGQKFAILEMKCILSKILRNFEIIPAKDKDPLLLCPELTLVSKEGIHVSLINRVEY